MIDESTSAVLSNTDFEVSADMDENRELRASEADAAGATPYDGREYEVVGLGIRPITFAFLCIVAAFTWPPFYFRVIGGHWKYAVVGVFCITLTGTLSAWQARRPPRQRTFASLIAMIINCGLLASVIVPVVAFYLVRYWPMY